MAYLEVASVGEMLSASLMEVDVGVEGSFGAWDQTILYGEWEEGSVIPTSKERLAVGSLGDDFVAVRIDPAWRRLYFGFGSERHTSYRPSFVPEADNGPVDDGEDMPPVDTGDAEDDQGWAEEYPGDVPEGEGETGEETDEDDPEMPYGTTLPLKHYVQSSAMGREIIFSWADQGAFHVMTSKPGRYTAMVTVFKKAWMPGPGFAGRYTPNHDPQNYIPVTPGRYKVRFPLPVELLDFAWNAYEQKMMWTRRSPREYWVSVAGDDEGERWVEMTVGQFTPPSEEAMAQYAMLDGYFYDSWATGLTPKAANAWNTFNKPKLKVLLNISSLQVADWTFQTPGGRFWVYTSTDHGSLGWKHFEQGFWTVTENIGS